MKFEKVSNRKSGCSIVIEFQEINVHTDPYVRKSREKANLIIRWGCLRNSIIATERTIDFHIVERVLDLS
jgi:hypothetical protein